jgi:elongator complex protein 6
VASAATEKETQGHTPATSKGLFSFTSPKLPDVESTIRKAIEHVGGDPNAGHGQTLGADQAQRRVLLIIDALDFLLATVQDTVSQSSPLRSHHQSRHASSSAPGQVNYDGNYNAYDFHALLNTLRQNSLVYSAVITASADQPLIGNHGGPLTLKTPLEHNHASYVLGLAHDASTMINLRLLDTGFAKDVSGVMRISKGASWNRNVAAEGGKKGGDDLFWGELLYYVATDGSVKVFERGSGTDVG